MIINEGGSGGKKLPILTNPGAAGDLLENKQLIDANGNILTGTMPTVDHPNPTISVGANGLITASHAQGSGKVTGGTTTATRQLTTQGGTTITPGTTQKTAVASGRYTTGPVYVAGSPYLVPANIKSGANIFGVVGTYQGSIKPIDVPGNNSTSIVVNSLSKSEYGYLLDCDTMMIISSTVNAPLSPGNTAYIFGGIIPIGGSAIGSLVHGIIYGFTATSTFNLVYAQVSDLGDGTLRLTVYGGTSGSYTFLFSGEKFTLLGFNSKL